MPNSPNPRVDPNCRECPGQFVYQEQVTDARGLPKSRFECNGCGREVTIT